MIHSRSAIPTSLPHSHIRQIKGLVGCFDRKSLRRSQWRNDKVTAHGIGAYIAPATEAGDLPRIVLAVAVMSVCVIIYNRLLWRPLFGHAERRLRIS